MTATRARNFQIYGTPLLLIVAAMTAVPTFLNMFGDALIDFDVFLLSARALREGHDPYRELLSMGMPNVNPPAFLLAVMPLTLVADRVAFAVWTAVAILGLIWSLDQTARALKLQFKHLLLVAAGLQGVSAALRFGQVTLLLLPLMTLAWLADRERRQDAAGAWLGALIYLKPFLGVYGLYMLWRREWRTVRSMIGVWIALAALGLMAGFRATLSWIETLRSISEKTSHVVNASWPALAARLFDVDLSQPQPAYRPFIVAPGLATALSLGGVLVIATLSALATRRTKNRDSHWAILAVAMLLMSPLGWMYYIPLLIPPLAAVVPSTRHLVLVLIAGAILWVPSSVLARNTFGPLATATIASPYTWGLMLLWAALCLEAKECIANSADGAS